MSWPPIKVGDKVSIIVEGTVTDYSDSHGLCYEVEFPKADFTRPRKVYFNVEEVDKSENCVTME